MDELTDEDTLAQALEDRGHEDETFPSWVLDELLDGHAPVVVFSKLRGVGVDQLADAIGVTETDIQDVNVAPNRSSLIKAISEELRIPVDLLTPHHSA